MRPCRLKGPVLAPFFILGVRSTQVSNLKWSEKENGGEPKKARKSCLTDTTCFVHRYRA